MRIAAGIGAASAWKRWRTTHENSINHNCSTCRQSFARLDIRAGRRQSKRKQINLQTGESPQISKEMTEKDTPFRAAMKDIVDDYRKLKEIDPTVEYITPYLLQTKETRRLNKELGLHAVNKLNNENWKKQKKIMVKEQIKEIKKTVKQINPKDRKTEAALQLLNEQIKSLELMLKGGDDDKS